MTNIARVGAIALNGLNGFFVTVEAGVTRQLPGIAIVGLPDAAMTEAKQRVRHAAAASGLVLTDRFVLVNLQPADLPKHGSGFDLSIALAVLATSGEAPTEGMEETVHLGELGIDGTLLRPRGLLTAVLAAKQLGAQSVMVPMVCAREAALVTGLNVIAAETLAGAVNYYRGKPEGWRSVNSHDERRDEQVSSNDAGDMADIVGQGHAIEALTVAAAGGHHVHMTGPPGAGKTMLAKRMTTILPDLQQDDAIEVASINALVSRTTLEELSYRPPFLSPHHTASAAAIIGSAAQGAIMPGIVTQATHGVLFLDEAAEFKPSVLDALRQPLESGVIEIHRAGVQATLPAKMQLILASNPCPCGQGGSPMVAATCNCTPMQRRRYATKISGPIRDRIDLQLEVHRVTNSAMWADDTERTCSKGLRDRVTEAQEAAKERWRGTPWKLNSQVPGTHLRSRSMRLPASVVDTLDRALMIGSITLRGYDRTVRLAWTICDLEGAATPSREHVLRAMMFRGTQS